jgi:hypothetical protein
LFVVSAKNHREESLQALNVRLKVDDTATPPERQAALERPYAAYKFPKYSKDEQVEKSYWRE